MKRFFYIILSIAVLVSLVPLSVYGANASYEILYDESWPSVAFSDTISQYTFGVFDYTGNPAITNRYCNIYKNAEEDYYFFLTYTSTIVNNQTRYQYNVIIAAEGVKADLPTCLIRVGTGTSTYNANLRQNSSYNDTYNLSYTSAGSLDENWDNRHFVPANVPVFNSQEEGLAALREAINNGTTGGGVPVTPKSGTVTVSPGYVAYIAVDGGTLTLYQDFPVKFGVEGIVTNQYYKWASALPSVDFVVNGSNSGNHLGWVQVPNTRDLLLRSNKGYINTIPAQTGYFVVYNPIQAEPIKMGVDYGTNGTIRVEASNLISVVQYPLVSNYNNGYIEGTGTIDEYYVADNEHIDEFGNIDYLHYSNDSEGNIVTQPAISLPAGGLSEIIEEDTSINGFIGKILELLQAPIRHIKQLFDSGTSFMMWLSQLWIWLPDDVTVVIASALVVLVVIGVIKFLWK